MGIHTVVPEVLVAGGGGVDGVAAVVKSEMEGDDRVAALRIENCELRIESGLRIYTIVPEVLVAGGDGLDGIGAIVKSEVESDGAVATLRIEG